MFQIGLERFISNKETWLKKVNGKRVGYLSNHASIGKNLIQGRISLQKVLGDQLTVLFSPQHGFFAEKQDNMIESAHSLDSETGLPLYSLYGDERKPSPEMFSHLDVLLVDMVDVGTRVYTFIYTMAYCLQAAAEQGKEIIILDRPNPIGGENVEGNILKPGCTSFVGLYPVPMRHGMTIGEFAYMINDTFSIGCSLDVVRMEGWERRMLMRDTGFPWIPPSPNMPTPETAMVYPGQVIWEGTQVSEGRGTTMPFEYFGAPYWRHDPILEFVNKTDLPGCFLRPIVFQPTSGKYMGENCTGFQIFVTDRDSFRPYRTSLAFLQAVLLLYPDQFSYKQPPYEYEFERLPMDLILGDKDLRKSLEHGTDIMTLELGWKEELEEFSSIRSKYLLY